MQLRPVVPPLFAALGAAAIGWGTVACSGDHGEPQAITQTREITVEVEGGVPTVDHRPVRAGASSVERFGEGPMQKPAQKTPQRELVWDNPPGWTELPPTDIRRANLQPAGNPEAECTLSVLPGGQEKLLDNVNRWRGQLGLAAVDAAAVASLPAASLMGLDAVRVSLEGDYTTMDGKAKPGFALLGVIASFADQSIFVKFTGPAAVVTAESANFDRFVQSLRLEEIGGKTASPAGTGSGATGAPASGDAAAANPLGGSNQGIRWTAPSGWTRDPDRNTRVATLRPPGTKETECAITSLSGDGGGLKSNIDRWRGQLGLSAATAEEIAALPKVTICGKEGVLLDIVGSFEDSMNSRSIAQARMVGALALLGDRSLFLKLTGPETEIDGAVRDAFLELCASLAR